MNTFFGKLFRISTIPLIAGIGLAASSHSRANAAPSCGTAANVLVVVAHPDDALAFMPENVRYQRQLGKCIRLLSLTSDYVYNRAFNRESAAIAAYTRVLSPNGSGSKVNLAASASLPGISSFGVSNDANMTLHFRRLLSSQFSASETISLMNATQARDAVKAMIATYRPDRIYTTRNDLPTVSNNNTSCTAFYPIQSSYCSHIDHVAAGIAAIAGATAAKQADPSLSFQLFKFGDYGIGGNTPWTWNTPLPAPGFNYPATSTWCSTQTVGSNNAHWCAMYALYQPLDPDASATPFPPFWVGHEYYQAPIQY
jgi:hypothetical protein